ncbi:probable 28S ribosomal protein S10, mitochondrial isoform X2 [Silurus meridionalis]|uniref:probable 28S ribosomal protein S10, mitochondrial isoform X2 n=1 Tax=Silurus meridionalis TaxID=175797 RepID=UPI001EEC1F14|nr:probable 28S ribosomal protein S10, mitochondrial isoform X2 [Silurus meridionalis]
MRLVAPSCVSSPLLSLHWRTNMAAPVRMIFKAGLASKTVSRLSLKCQAAVQRCVCSTDQSPTVLSWTYRTSNSVPGYRFPTCDLLTCFCRTHINVSPAAFVSTANVPSSHSPPVTVTDEPDLLFQKLVVLVKGHDKAVLDSYEFFVTLAAKELGLTLTKVFEPPNAVERLTLLKSVHIFKKHRVQYEMRTHYRSIEIAQITGSTADVYLEYIQRNLPEGMAMEVTKTAIEKVPDHIQTPVWDKESQQEASQ